MKFIIAGIVWILLLISLGYWEIAHMASPG